MPQQKYQAQHFHSGEITSISPLLLISKLLKNIWGFQFLIL
nr:MAG TPA: hypothetical protein [Caudoviricetes sp.]